jgi:hypothetical protein
VSIVVLAGLEVVGQGVSLMRFGRVAAVHAYSGLPHERWARGIR